MLSEDVCMDVSRIDIEMVSEQRAQARRIERGARADHTRVGGTLNSAAKCAARCVMTSTGLVTTSKTASGAWRRIGGHHLAKHIGVPPQ